MPGIAQVWLTQKEIAALLAAGQNKGTTVSPAVWEGLEPKLTSARDALGCPVPQSQPSAWRWGDDGFD